jgi:hypothetical protein
MTHLTASLNAGSLFFFCYNFLSFLLCFNERSELGILHFLPKIVVFLVDILYAEDIEAAKSRVTLSASSEM